MQSTQTELDFINLYLERLSSKSVCYADDYTLRTLPSPLRIKRVPVQPVAIQDKEPSDPRTTTTTTTTTTTANSDTIQVTIKVLKPASQFTIAGLSLDNTVHQLKQRIYQQQSSLPVNRQRLLIKGKVLADQKTLAELSIQPNAVIHLMVAATATATATATSTATVAPPSTATATATTGRFGISAQTEQKLASPEFWSALEKTITDQVGEAADAKLLLSKMKEGLSLFPLT